MMTQTITVMKAFRADAFLVAMSVIGRLPQTETIVVKHSGALAANDGLPFLWISFRNLPGTLSSFEYDVTVSDSPKARPNDR
jgi:hypothetical protein